MDVTRFGTVEPSALSNATVSGKRTEELMNRLLVFRAARRAECPGEDCSHVQEFLEYLDRAQRQLDQERESTAGVRQRTELLVSGSQDRERRYRSDIVAAQDRLLDYTNEHKELKAVVNRYSVQLQQIGKRLMRKN